MQSYLRCTDRHLALPIHENLKIKTAKKAQPPHIPPIPVRLVEQILALPDSVYNPDEPNPVHAVRGSVPRDRLAPAYPGAEGRLVEPDGGGCVEDCARQG